MQCSRWFGFQTRAGRWRWVMGDGGGAWWAEGGFRLRSSSSSDAPRWDAASPSPEPSASALAGRSSREAPQMSRIKLCLAE
eukprot:2649733-Pyramimonas_sp.AAC.1